MFKTTSGIKTLVGWEIAAILVTLGTFFVTRALGASESKATIATAIATVVIAAAVSAVVIAAAAVAAFADNELHVRYRWAFLTLLLEAMIIAGVMALSGSSLISGLLVAGLGIAALLLTARFAPHPALAASAQAPVAENGTS